MYFQNILIMIDFQQVFTIYYIKYMITKNILPESPLQILSIGQVLRKKVI